MNYKKTCESLSNVALELDGNSTINKREYDGEDLSNICLVFIHILGNMSADYCNRKGLTQKQAGQIAIELGKNIKQTVLLGTGIDMHALTKRLFNK